MDRITTKRCTRFSLYHQFQFNIQLRLSRAPFSANVQFTLFRTKFSFMRIDMTCVYAKNVVNALSYKPTAKKGKNYVKWKVT